MGLIGFASWLLVPIFSSVHCGSKNFRDFYNDKMVFDSNGYDEMIISSGIKYYTFCEHHMLPFFGKAHIGYIPNGKIVGLSKLARTVEYFSKGLNTQEYLTNNIANLLNTSLVISPLAIDPAFDDVINDCETGVS